MYPSLDGNQMGSIPHCVEAGEGVREQKNACHSQSRGNCSKTNFGLGTLTLSLSLLSSPFSLPSDSLSLSLALSLSLSSCLAPFAAMKPLPYLIKNYVPPATTIVGRDFQGQAANISLLWNINLVIDLVLETKPGMGFLWFSGEASGLRTTSHAKPATVPKG